MFPEAFIVRAFFPQGFSVLPYVNFNENPSMRAVANILRARTREHLSYFCEQFEDRPNFASTFKLNGTIQYPYNNFDTNGLLSTKCEVKLRKLPINNSFLRTKRGLVP